MQGLCARPVAAFNRRDGSRPADVLAIIVIATITPTTSSSPPSLSSMK